MLGRLKANGEGMRRLDGLADSMDMSPSKHQEMVKDREVGCAAVQWTAKSQV